MSLFFRFLRPQFSFKFEVRQKYFAVLYFQLSSWNVLKHGLPSLIYYFELFLQQVKYQGTLLESH